MTLKASYPDLPPIHITENGVAYDDPIVDGAVHDERRIAYLDCHLRALHAAIAAGVDVRAYFQWSLLDNFEWSHGFHMRFGLVHVDYDTQVRTPRDSALWYRDVIARNGLADRHVGRATAGRGGPRALRPLRRRGAGSTSSPGRTRRCPGSTTWAARSTSHSYRTPRAATRSSATRGCGGCSATATTTRRSTWAAASSTSATTTAATTGTRAGSPRSASWTGTPAATGWATRSSAAQRGGIRVETTYLVPPGQTLEVWRVRVTNERPEPARLSLFGAVEFCLWDAQDDATNFQRNLSTGEVLVEDEVIYHLTEYRERRDHFAWFACSQPVAGFETSRERFLGAYRGWDRPVAVERGTLSGSIAHGWQPIGALQASLELEPGETRDVTFVLGYTENPPAAQVRPAGLGASGHAPRAGGHGRLPAGRTGRARPGRAARRPGTSGWAPSRWPPATSTWTAWSTPGTPTSAW